jgi:hypothetical protein
MTDILVIKAKLVKQAVNRLRKLGFVHVNKTNIETDEVYSLYFLKILKEKLGENEEVDIVINQLLITMNLKNQVVR